VKSGYRTVSISLALLAVLSAPDAGRDGESGTGAMWIAPELAGAATPTAQAQPCSQSIALHARELLFETIGPGEGRASPLLAHASREMVRFEWNPATGELSYDTDAPTGVFSDLAASSRLSDHPAPSSCGSR
jgi:hypothetical protein